MWMISNLLTFLFPPRCLGCAKPATALCERCITLTRKSLSSPLPYCVSVFDFKDPLIKRAIHAIKYYHRKDLISPLAQALAEELKRKNVHADTILIPVPMPRLRKLLRGYNQSELIAKELGDLLGLPVEKNTLKRVSSPSRQATIKTRALRLANQHGTFAVDADIREKTFMLIDDVTTTGATLEEARTVLLKHKAKAVYAATLAH